MSTLSILPYFHFNRIRIIKQDIVYNLLISLVTMVFNQTLNNYKTTAFCGCTKSHRYARLS